jgi:5-dehydro-2-deoxygluconokinase
VKGFAVGRTIFAEAARGYMAGEVDGAGAAEMMRQNYARLCALWDDACATAERHAA